MMVGFAFVFLPQSASSHTLHAQAIAENVGLDVYISVRNLKANPRIKDRRCLHPAMGVGIILIRGRGPQFPTLNLGTP